jgi:hypothetical protein
MIAATIAIIGLGASIDQLWGPFWPTTPEISLQAASAGSSEALPFEITNQSVLFKIKDANLVCFLDLIYFIDADHKTGILRDASFSEGAIPIDPNIAYSCDSKFIRLRSDGSLEIGFPTAQNMATKPGVFREPIRILKMCVQISGSYSTYFGAKQFKSAMFQWPATPSGGQWIKGPIAFDVDQDKWIPKDSTLGAAWGLRGLTEGSGAGDLRLRPDALRCDWSTQPRMQIHFGTTGRLSSSFTEG